MSHISPEISDYEVDRAFDRIIKYAAIGAFGDQLVTEQGLFIKRPCYWMEVAGDETSRAAYEECLDTWSSMIDEKGRFTGAGLQVANLVVDPDSTMPTFEEYISDKYGYDDKTALAYTSRAMWDLLFLRGIPASKSKNT